MQRNWLRNIIPGKKGLLRILIGMACLFVVFLILDRIAPLPSGKEFSPVVYDRNGNLLSAGLTSDDQWRLQTQADSVPDVLIRAILTKEDQYFYWHPGVNPFAVIRAAWNNLMQGKRTSGASTITMQVARMVERRPRTLKSKLIEVFRAFQLEWHCSKSEILGMYLSYLPYGGNIEGVTAASYLYFDRPPRTLSLSQATLLTIIPNRPNSLRLDTKIEPARAARDAWLRRFRTWNTFPESQIDAALREPMQVTRRSFPRKAPHLSRLLMRQQPMQAVHSTIDPEVQHQTEVFLAQHVRELRSRGISNGAVLVVSNRTMEVLAYCGSADFSDVDALGQVDGVRAVRSPGSALKPVVYGMAFDAGLMTPDSRLLDIPRSWAGYAPTNYDDEFHGAVSVSEALRYSLNLTAVHMLDLVGLEAFLDLMQKAGMKTIVRQRKQLGLSVVLGGCGVTLEEMTRLYAAIANEGRIRPLNYTQGQDSTGGYPLFSQGSAWLLQDILSGIERPDLPQDLIDATNRPQIAWKTGTSYGRRDAWSIGFTPRYTVGIWMGNFNGHGAADLSGSSVAVPLLFDIIGALEQGNMVKDFARPRQVWKREICAETGNVAAGACPEIRKGYYLRNVSPRNVCEQEKMLYVSGDSSIQYCPACLPVHDYLKASFPILPAELTLFYENQGIPYRKPPPHFAACTGVGQGSGPKIVSPELDFEYWMEKGAGQEILLQAASDTRVGRHYWYVDGIFFRSGVPGERIFWPTRPGTAVISCMDDRGRTTEVKISIKSY